MAIPNASGLSQSSSRSEQAERVHTPPGLDDLSILEAVDRDAGNRDPPARWRYTPQLAGMGHLPTPTRNDLVALRNLILNGELHVGEGVAIQLDRAFHPGHTLSGMGVIGIVVDDVSSDQLIKPIDLTGAPDHEHRSRHCLVVLSHRVSFHAGTRESRSATQCRQERLPERSGLDFALELLE